MMLAAKPLNATRAVAMRATSGRVSAKARRSLVVRAVDETKNEEDVTGSTVFYAGNTYNSEEEWKAAVESGKVAQPAPAAPSATAEAQALSIGELMSFSGPAPELINSRLAMLGFVAALFAELSSGESVLRQWASEPTGIALTFITFSVASLIPLLSSTKREAFGPFTPDAETLNGRAAMIGFAALLAVEAVKGTALF